MYIYALSFYLFVYFVFEKQNLSSLFLQIRPLKWCPKKKFFLTFGDFAVLQKRYSQQNH